MLRPKTHTLRVLMLLVTLLALTGQGVAAATQVSACQAQMATAAVRAKAVHSVAAASDCCQTRGGRQGVRCELPGKSKFPGTGDSCSLCKAGFNCKSPQPFESNAFLLPFLEPTRVVLSARPVAPLPFRSPDGLWRPPTRT
jgi:hypothetical protein